MNSSKNLQILIVEDNPGDEFFLSELIDLSGLNINALHKAISLGMAMDIIQHNFIDLILLDLSLPDSSGIDSFKAMKAAATDVPIVILSGLTDMKVALDAINLGAQDFLIKGDFDEKMLAKTILYSMERMRSIKQLQESNERYNLIRKATNDMVWDWDLITGKVYRNKEGWRKILRTGNKDIDNESMNDWDDRIHPDDKENVRQNIEEILTSDKDFFEVECRI